MSDSLNIGFIGLGLIGGSIAKSLKRFHPQTRIFAYTRTEATLDLAVSEGIVDVKCTKEDEAFASCDYIFLCAPVHDNISYLEWLKDHISPDCIITDVGSVKGEIHQAVQKLGLDDHFIGGHPMAGSEKTGFENATDMLIENAYYILTPGGQIDIPRLTQFMELISSLGAIPLVLTYEEHDYMGIQHRRSARYEIVLDFVKEKYPEQADVMRELLTYDYYLRENAKSRPEFAGEDATDKRFVRAFYEEEEKERKHLPGYEQFDRNQMRKMTHLEYFPHMGKMLLFDYKFRNPLNQEARTCMIKKDSLERRG